MKNFILITMFIVLGSISIKAFSIESRNMEAIGEYEKTNLVYALLHNIVVPPFLRVENDNHLHYSNELLIRDLQDFIDITKEDSVYYGSTNSSRTIKIEGLVWVKHPHYWDSDNDRIKDFWENKKGYGTATALMPTHHPMIGLPNTYRQGNPAGWNYGYRSGIQNNIMGRDTICPISKDWCHVWATPEEALNHPADIELYVKNTNGIKLSDYLGVHYYEESIDWGINNKEIKTWKFDDEELRQLGFVWVFDTIDYYDYYRAKHNSRYIRFKDHKTGLIVAQNIREVGAPYEDETNTAIEAEPLIRVRLYHIRNIKEMERWNDMDKYSNGINDFNKDNINNDVNSKFAPVLDGYIRVHITNTELLEINSYPAWDITYDLSNSIKTEETTWQQFSKLVLTNELHNMEREQYDAAYQGDYTGLTVNGYKEMTQYSKPRVTISEDKFYCYNKLDDLPSGIIPDKDKKIGRIWEKLNNWGECFHTYYWELTAEELEILTQELTSPEDVVNVERYIHYTGHFYSSTLPYNRGAFYDDIFIKLTVNIKKGNQVDMQCSKPIIRYNEGKLLFKSETDGAVCESTITDSDITSYRGNEVQLGVTYQIFVRATKEGYKDSETATATLCWIEVEPQKEGITEDDGDDVSEVKSMPVLIQREEDSLTIEGAEPGTSIAVYKLNGVKIGEVEAVKGTTRISCSDSDKIIIVKVGNKSVKVS